MVIRGVAVHGEQYVQGKKAVLVQNEKILPAWLAGLYFFIANFSVFEKLRQSFVEPKWHPVFCLAKKQMRIFVINHRVGMRVFINDSVITERWFLFSKPQHDVVLIGSAHEQSAKL